MLIEAPQVDETAEENTSEEFLRGLGQIETHPNVSTRRIDYADSADSKYPVLKAIALIYKILGFLSMSLSLGALFVCGFMFFQEGVGGDWGREIVVFSCSLISTISFFTVSELIIILIDIKKDTRLLRYR
jgi:hypothetical protein